MKKILLFIILLFVALDANATVYYVRTDGGTDVQCSGTVDQAYDGGAHGTNCAFSHPFYKLDWCGDWSTLSACNHVTKMNPGDKLVIVSGSYNMGYSASWANCSDSWSYGCASMPIPSGDASSQTTVIGCSVDGCGCSVVNNQLTCTTPLPELYGVGRVKHILNLDGSSNVKISDLNINDHAKCGTGHPTLSCASGSGPTMAAEQSALDGIVGWNWNNIQLSNLDIHGFYRYGVWMGKGVNLDLTNVFIHHNALGGFEADVCQRSGLNSSDTAPSCVGQYHGITGSMGWTNVHINYNGCVEPYPTSGTASCFSQDQGGNGDGFGSFYMGGDWVFNNSDFSYNVADGLDMLYLCRGEYNTGANCSLSFIKSRAEGNGGNSTKGPNAFYAEDSFMLGNCGYFQGQSFTYDSNSFNHCRANTGSPLAIEFKSGDSRIPTIYNSTISSNGDIAILTSGVCTSGTNIISKGNIFIGGRQWNDDSSNPNANPGPGDGAVDLFYSDGGTCSPTLVDDYNTIVGEFKETDWFGVHDVYTASYSNVFSGTVKQGPYSTTGYFGSENYSNSLYLKSGSTALGVSNENGLDANDFNNFARGSAWDGGAVELGSSSSGGGSSTTPPTTSVGGVKIILGGGKITQ